MRRSGGRERAASPVARALRAACVALVVTAFAACGGRGPEDDSAAQGVGPIVERAEAAAAHGDLDAAISGYDEALKRTPWNTRLRSQLVAAYSARAAEKRRKPGGAVGLALAEADLRAAHELAPDDATVTRSLAAILLERSAYEADDGVAAEARAEATALAPDLAAQAPATRLPVERRLDLAYELIERGNLDAGIDQLQAVARAYPQNPQAARMLGQALVRLGGQQTQSHDYDGARESFTLAVAQYARLLPCDGARCDSSELELAHRNRILSALDAQRWDAARGALAEAEAIGLSFPDLRARWPELSEP